MPWILIFIILTGCASSDKKSILAPVLVMNETEDQLFTALSIRDQDKIMDLLPKVRPTVKNDFKETFLHKAIGNGVPMLSLLLEKGVPLDSPSTFSETPLSKAIEKKEIKEAEFLLSKGANVNQKDMLGNPLFFKALENKHIPSLKLLMRFKFDPFVKGFMDKESSEFKFAEADLLSYRRSYKKQ